MHTEIKELADKATLDAAVEPVAEAKAVGSMAGGAAKAYAIAPGPIVQAEIVQTAHPIFSGYTETRLPVRYGNVPEADKGQILMRYPDGDDSVLRRGAALERRQAGDGGGRRAVKPSP